MNVFVWCGENEFRFFCFWEIFFEKPGWSGVKNGSLADLGVSDLPRVKSCCVFENERGNAFRTQLDYLYMNDIRIYISISIKKETIK